MPRKRSIVINSQCSCRCSVSCLIYRPHYFIYNKSCNNTTYNSVRYHVRCGSFGSVRSPACIPRVDAAPLLCVVKMMFSGCSVLWLCSVGGVAVTCVLCGYEEVRLVKCYLVGDGGGLPKMYETFICCRLAALCSFKDSEMVPNAFLLQHYLTLLSPNYVPWLCGLLALTFSLLHKETACCDKHFCLSSVIVFSSFHIPDIILHLVTNFHCCIQ